MTECERIINDGILPESFFKEEVICDFLVTEEHMQVEEKNMFDYVEHHTPAIMEELGIPMYFSKGSHSNIKITEKEGVDMFLGYQLAKQYKKEHPEECL